MSSQSFSQLKTLNLQYNGIKITRRCSDVNCLKGVCIKTSFNGKRKTPTILCSNGSLRCG